MKRNILTAIIIWLIISFFNFGAINADELSHGHYCRTVSPRKNYAGNMVIAMVPGAGLLMAIFGTGFTEAGFDWSMGHCDEHGILVGSHQ